MPFDWDAVTAPFRMQPGLRRVAAGAPVLTPNAIGSAHLRAKCDVLRRQPRSALLAEPGFDATPVIDTLVLENRHGGPSGLRREADGRLVAPNLGWSVHHDEVDALGECAPEEIGSCLSALPPDRRAAGLASLAYAEDFAVIDGASRRIPWLAVCLPSHWSPAEKLGLPLAAIHAPVADSATLVAASDALVRLVTAGERWERFVWTLTPRAALDAHPERLELADWPTARAVDDVAAAAFFRTEHQRFVPMASALRQALFTIRVDMVPLAEAVNSSDRAARLHAALASMSDAVLAYRGLAPVRDALLVWLERRMAR